MMLTNLILAAAAVVGVACGDGPASPPSSRLPTGSASTALTSCPQVLRTVIIATRGHMHRFYRLRAAGHDIDASKPSHPTIPYLRDLGLFPDYGSCNLEANRLNYENNAYGDAAFCIPADKWVAR